MRGWPPAGDTRQRRSQLTRGAESESESESESPGVVATSQESESESESVLAASTPTPDRLLQFDPIRGGEKYFSVKFSGISPFFKYLRHY